MSDDRLFYGRREAIAQQIEKVIDDLCDWWPLTVRQVYYQLVAHHGLPNNLASYKTVSAILATLRRADRVPWEAIEDRGRRSVKEGIDDLSTFVAAQAEGFLNPDWYHRCKVQSQPVYVEVMTEKDALASIFENTLAPYCLRLNVVRGQASATMVNQIAGRLDTARRKGQKLKLLHFGDFDPSGVAIPRAIRENLRVHHGLDVPVTVCALRPAQIKKHKLPDNPDAVKRTDPNYAAFIGEFGKDATAVELDALHPDLLTKLIHQSVRRHLDMDEVGVQMALEAEDEKRLRAMRRDVLGYMARKFPELRGSLPKA